MDLVIRAAVVFFFIFLITRIAGRRQLSTLEPFDVILLVVLGDLVQQGITQSDESVTGTLIVISTITLLSVAVSWASFRSYNNPTRYIRHSDYVLRIDPVSTATEQQDATFRVGY